MRPPPPSADPGPHAAARGEQRGLELRHDPALEGAVAEHAVGVVDGDPARRRRPSRRTPGTSLTNTICSAPRPTASAAAASSALTLSGCPSAARGERRDDGDPAFGERLLDGAGRGRHRVADEPERLDLRRREPDLVAEERHRLRARSPRRPRR